ncbi:MAG: sulfatase [Candidatus Fermentibacteraceae bacterium]|nr:sulfatase [Candidatus Fermentibacteraceae bacterium]
MLKRIICPAAMVIIFTALIGCQSGTVDERPSVLLILIDTVRADHLNCYGYPRETSPVLDSLASEGTRWADVQGQSSWTLPAMASIFTGTSERSHRAGFRNGQAFGISEDLITLPEILRNEGYVTAAFFNVPVMAPSYGFTSGFDFYDCRGCSVSQCAREVIDSSIMWLDRCRQPFFIALHLFDPHAPYEPPEPFAGYWSDPDYTGFNWAGALAQEMISGFSEGAIDSAGMAQMIALYDGELAYTDSQIGRLVQYMNGRGLLHNTLIVIVADHGEEFGEHGRILHGFQLYEETTRVPLIVIGQDIPAGYVDHNVVGHIDIMPSILDYLDVPVPQQAQGRSFFGLEQDAQPELLPASGYFSSGDWIVVRYDSLKVFWNTADDLSKMFDIQLDRGELNPLPADSLLVDDAMLYWATPALADPDPVPSQGMFVEKLMDLGYI